MALDTYDGLKASIADWLNKTNLANQIPDFIRLAEAQFNRELDTREMVDTITLSAASEDYPLPCDFAGVKSFRVEGSPSLPLQYVLPEALDSAFGTGRPCRYTITDRIVLDPVPDAAYSMRLRYRKRVPALSSSRRCNWLLDKHPDVYLYGSLMQAAPYLRDDARIAVWGSMFASALDAITQDDKRQAHPSTTNAAGRTF